MPTYLDYINQAFNNKQYKDAVTEANKATQELTTLQSQLPNYLENKQRELVAADPALQQLNAERAKFAGQLYSKPMEARSQYSDILDPVKREALVSQAIGNIVGQLQGTEGMIGLRKQTNQDLAQQAYNLLQSNIDIAKTRAGNAADSVSSLKKLLETAAGKEFDRNTTLTKAGIDNNTGNYSPQQYASDMFDAWLASPDTFDATGYASTFIPNKGENRSLAGNLFRQAVAKYQADNASKSQPQPVTKPKDIVDVGIGANQQYRQGVGSIFDSQVAGAKALKNLVTGKKWYTKKK